MCHAVPFTSANGWLFLSKKKLPGDKERNILSVLFVVFAKDLDELRLLAPDLLDEREGQECGYQDETEREGIQGEPDREHTEQLVWSTAPIDLSRDVRRHHWSCR